MILIIIKNLNMLFFTIKDDIIHLIMKIHAPLIKVKSGYVLMGSVGKQVLRGDGVLNAQFSKFYSYKL